MSNFDAFGGTISHSLRDNDTLIFDQAISQVSGVGGSGGDYQALATASYPAATLASGYFICRFISGYVPASDTKTGIEAEFGITGWPIAERVVDLNGAGTFGLTSASNLNSGVEYHALFFWISDYYYDAIFINGATTGLTLHDAINDTDAQGGTTVWPVDNSVIATSGLTISGNTSPATDIAFTGTVVTSAAAGTVIGTATANRTNGTFSEGTPALSWVTVATDGTLTVTTGQTAPSAGDYSIQLTYDNSAITGGGTYSEVVTITVTEATASTPRFIAFPTVNADGDGQDLSLSEAESLVDTLKSNWASGCTTLGIATTGVDVVLEFATGSLGNMVWANKGPFSDGSNTRYVHIRGQGPYSHNSWQPTAGTNIGHIDLNNCSGLRFWGIAFEHDGSGTGAIGHYITNCSDLNFTRCHIAGDVAENSTNAANIPANDRLINPAGSSNVEWRQCTFMAYGNALWQTKGDSTGERTGSCTNLRVKESVTDQHAGDIWNFSSSAYPALNFVIEDFYASGYQRCGTAPPGSDAKHIDFLQCQNSGIAEDWTINGLFFAWRGHWGVKKNYGGKPFQEAGGASLDSFVISNMMMMSGASIGSGGPDSTTVSYSDYMPPTDVDWDEYSERGGTSLWQSKWGGWNTVVNSSGTLNSCTAFANASEPVGANGLAVNDSGFTAIQDSNYDWGAYADHLEFYQAASTPATARTTAIPRHTYGIGQWKPKSTSRLHWNNANPVGAYEFKRRIYETSGNGGDNPWFWGWPTCALFAIRYDPEELCGGAGANSSGTSFDANGD